MRPEARSPNGQSAAAHASIDTRPEATTVDAAPRPDLEGVERALGCFFRDRGLLKLALVHSSYFNEHPDETPASNERLEYLGDALLDFVVAEELYRRRPQSPEGELTALRAALVCGESLARLGMALALGDHLLLGQGEEATGGRKRASNVAAVFEALAGALLMDQGYEVARACLLRVLAPELERLSIEGVPKDPKSLLQELVQAQGKPSPSYRTVGEQGPEHARQYTLEVAVDGEVLGRGSGDRKVEAEREAARAALERFRDTG